MMKRIKTIGLWLKSWDNSIKEDEEEVITKGLNSYINVNGILILNKSKLFFKKW